MLKTFLKNYLRVFGKEASLLKTSPHFVLAILVIILIPTIYSVIYIGALWDPYGKLHQLPVGLVNLDEETEFKGSKYHLGKELIEELKNKGTFRFRDYSSRSAAEDAVRSGEVYFALVVPTGFTSQTLPGQEPGKLQLLTSDGTSFVAGLMANRFAQVAAQKLNQKLSIKRWEKAFSAGDSLHDAVIKLKNGSYNSLKGSMRLSEGLIKSVSGSGKLFQNQKKIAEALKGIDSGLLIESGSKLHDNTYKLATELAKPRLLGAIAGLPPSEDLIKLAEGAQTYQTKIEELAGGIDQMAEGASALAEKQGELTEGLNELNAGADSLVSGLEKLYEGLLAMQEAMPNEKKDPQGYAISVVAEEKEIIPVKINGPAFAPYFMSLSIWLGVVVTTFLFHIIVYPKSMLEIPLLAKILGKGSLPVIIASIAAFVLGLTIHVFMNVSLVHPFGFYFTLVFSAFAYGTIILSLIRLIGDAGKLLSVLFLVLQIASAGGAYPIELSAPFYQNIAPYLPLTHTLEALRAAMFGSYSGQWYFNLIWLIPWVVISIGLSTLSKKRFRHVEDSEYGPALDLSFARRKNTA